MKRTCSSFARVIGIEMTLSLLFVTAAPAQTITGQATAVHATLIDLLSPVITVLSDTGPLAGPDDAREASLLEGAVSSLLTVNTLHATSISWTDRAASESSVADLLVTVAGQMIGAEFARATAQASPGSGGTGESEIDGLSINGVPISVTGVPNQVIAIPGGKVILNEQQIGPQSARVNALHVIVSGVADVIVASAKSAF